MDEQKSTADSTAMTEEKNGTIDRSDSGAVELIVLDDSPSPIMIAEVENVPVDACTEHDSMSAVDSADLGAADHSPAVEEDNHELPGGLFAYGRPMCLAPALVTSPVVCLIYTVLLVILCYVNAYFLVPIDQYFYAEWWQSIRLLNEVGLLNSALKIQYVVCLVFSIAFLARCGRTAAVYGRGGLATVAAIPLFVLLVVPLTQLLNSSLVSALSFVHWFSAAYSSNRSSLWNIVSASCVPALFLCGLGAIVMLAKTLWRMDRRIVLYEDGMAVGLRRARFLFGERPVLWSDIARVEMVSTDNAAAKVKPNPIVRVHLKSDATLEFTWKEIADSCDPSDLFSALKTAAPHAVPDGIVLHDRQSSAHSDHSYTELWLKYFTTGSKRERTGKLEDKLVLNNGRYTVIGEIGSGGQGTAYLAVPAAGVARGYENVVLKEYIMPLHRGEALFQQSMKKLEQESSILKKIDHPQIVKLLDHFVEDHRGYLVLDYVDGTPLKQLVQSQGPQVESQVIELAIQVCQILEYLHGLQPSVVHRDLTPDNLILQETGYVKLVDFNVAQQLESGATATVVGKHAFIPPEQFRGKPVAQSDLYALGGTLHYLLTGQDPEPLSSSRPREINEAISSELDAIIAKSTALDCAKRYSSAADMKADLLDLQSRLQIKEKP